MSTSHASLGRSITLKVCVNEVWDLYDLSVEIENVLEAETGMAVSLPELDAVLVDLQLDPPLFGTTEIALNYFAEKLQKARLGKLNTLRLFKGDVYWQLFPRLGHYQMHSVLVQIEGEKTPRILQLTLPYGEIFLGALSECLSWSEFLNQLCLQHHEFELQDSWTKEVYSHFQSSI